MVVDPEERGYFATLSDYIHLNPVRARIVSLDERLFDYRWSSYRWYAATTGRAEWFEPRRVLGELDLPDTADGRRRYAERMRDRAVSELSNEPSSAREELRRGWCIGGESFRERMLRLLENAGERMRGKSPVDGAIRQSYGEDAARRILACGLELFGMEREELPQLKKGDQRKLAMGAMIRKRTAVDNAWIARELHLGHVSRVSRCGRAEPSLVSQLAKALDR